jgi:hypothetical protein
VSIATTTITNAQTNGQIQFTFVLSVVSTGTSGTFEAHGSLQVQGGAAIGVAVPTYLDQNTAVSSAVDLTAAEAVVVTVASSGAAGLSSCQLRQALLECLN